MSGRPLIVSIFDSETGSTKEIQFSRSPVRIGRNSKNDIQLPFKFVSGWHAVVRFNDDSAAFSDIGSTNGSLVRGKRVATGEEIAIKDQLSVTIGKIELQFSRGEKSAARAEKGRKTASPTLIKQERYQANRSGRPLSEPPMLLSRETLSGTEERHTSPTNEVPPPLLEEMAKSVVLAKESNTDLVNLANINDMVRQLRPLYEAYEQAAKAWNSAVEQAIKKVPGTHREVAAATIEREFPHVRGEPAPIWSSQSISEMAPPPLGARYDIEMVAEQSDLRSVARLASALLTEVPPPSNPSEVEWFLTRVEEVLRANAKAFVDLRNVQEQFGNEMGVQAIQVYSPLHAACTVEAVLNYLLDWRSGGSHRTQEMANTYSDMVQHQVALINGVMQGVRSTLHRLDPHEIEREVTAPWPTRAGAVWKLYMERYRALTEIDKNLVEAVFGPEFVQTYAEVGGRGSQR